MHLDIVLGYLTTYRYLLIIPLTIVEGPIVMILCGFLLRMGTFNLIPLYFALTAGDLIGDVWWYGVGRYGGFHFIRKYGHFFSISEKSVEKVSALFHKHHNKILFISKITMGFGFALVTLITAGIAKVPFKKYLVLNFLGQLIWTGVLLAVGYLFGQIYSVIDKGLREIALVSLVVIALALVYGLGKYISQIIGERL